MEIFQWLNDQLLRMDWLHWLVRLLAEDGFGLDMATRLGGSLHFFIYDVIKILILLSVLIFAISWVQSYFPPERTRRVACAAFGPTSPAPCWALSRRSVPARRSRCSSASPAPDCRWG